MLTNYTMGPPVRLLPALSMRKTTERNLCPHTMAEGVAEEFRRAADRIKNADILLVMSGAGMSAESGLRTYEEMNRESLHRL